MCTRPHYRRHWKNMFRERKWGGAWCAHCPVIDAAEKTCFGRENGVVCDVHLAPLLTPLKKHILGEKTGQCVMCTPPCYRRRWKNLSQERKRGSVWCAHRPVIDTAEKICLGRENGAACDVHTAPLSTLLKKHVLGEKTGRCVMCTLPCYQRHWKNMSQKRKWGGVWCAHCPIIDAAEKTCLGRENGVACDVHTTPLSTPLKKYVSGKKTGQHVMCTLPHYWPHGKEPPIGTSWGE